MYCNIRCEGFNEQYGDGRTVYDYYNEDSKFVEYIRVEKLPESTWIYMKNVKLAILLHQKLSYLSILKKNVIICY
jgi:hypothetical protein